MAPNFGGQLDKPGGAKRFHREKAVNQPKKTKTTPLIADMIPAGKNFPVFRKRKANMTVRAKDAAIAIEYPARGWRWESR